MPGCSNLAANPISRRNRSAVSFARFESSAAYDKTQLLQRNDTPRLGLLRPPHEPHAALAYPGEESVAAEGGEDRFGYGPIVTMHRSAVESLIVERISH